MNEIWERVLANSFSGLHKSKIICSARVSTNTSHLTCFYQNIPPRPTHTTSCVSTHTPPSRVSININTPSHVFFYIVLPHMFLLVYTHHLTCFYWSTHTTSRFSISLHTPPHVFLFIYTHHLTCFWPPPTTSHFSWLTYAIPQCYWPPHTHYFPGDPWIFHLKTT